MKEGEPLSLKFSVTWDEEDKYSYEDRFDAYLNMNFLSTPTHWFSIFNSGIIVVVLLLIVFAIIAKSISNDYQSFNRRRMQDDIPFDKIENETVWKQLHGDIYRTPKHLGVLAALLGTGTQIVLLSLSLIILGFTFYSK